MIRIIVGGILLLFAANACALLPEPAEESDIPVDVASFVDRLEEYMEAHAWQSILAAADPALYRQRVVELGTREPDFVAELLGLKLIPADTIAPAGLSWSDLERIGTVSLMRRGEGGPPYRIGGGAVLEGGQSIAVRASVTRVQGRYVLTESTD